MITLRQDISYEEGIMTSNDALIRAIVAGARTFADTLEAELTQASGDETTLVPMAGTADSMRILLERVAEVNAQGRGVTALEMSRFAREAGMDPRGTAGYYAAGLLATRGEERWITAEGTERLRRLKGDGV